MRVLVTGATGNVGTSVVRALAIDDAVEEIVGIARRPPDGERTPKVKWQSADVTCDRLDPYFKGIDVVIHLAWAIQPSRDRRYTRTVNVDGTKRTLDAAARAKVPAFIHASSIGAYSPGPESGEAVDETWPTGGVASSFYSVDKAATERLLDDYAREHPEHRTVRLRPALIFKRKRRRRCGASSPARSFLDAWLHPIVFPFCPGRQA